MCPRSFWRQPSRSQNRVYRACVIVLQIAQRAGGGRTVCWSASATAMEPVTRKQATVSVMLVSMSPVLPVVLVTWKQVNVSVMLVSMSPVLLVELVARKQVNVSVLPVSMSPV